jgi:hypothetical protein
MLRVTLTMEIAKLRCYYAYQIAASATTLGFVHKDDQRFALAQRL